MCGPDDDAPSFFIRFNDLRSGAWCSAVAASLSYMSGTGGLSSSQAFLKTSAGNSVAVIGKSTM